jgi:ribosomal protein S18 acetylase RimI-like enzyme
MITIRPSGLQDINEIWKLNSAWVSPKEPKSNLEAVLATPSSKAWVAVDDGAVVAALVGKLKLGLPYIHSVVTASTHRGKGIATHLFDQFEKAYPGDNYWLQAHFNNAAQKLYFDLGYRVKSIDMDFYGRNHHALCMYKGPQV